MIASTLHTATRAAVTDLPAIRSLRKEAWAGEPGVPPELAASWLAGDDPHDRHGLHWVVREGSDIIAAARLCIHPDASELPDCSFYPSAPFGFAPPIGSLNRLVVHPQYRGCGLSKILDEARFKAAIDCGGQSVIAAVARTQLRSFPSLGFEVLSEFTAKFVRFGKDEEGYHAYPSSWLAWRAAVAKPVR